MGTFPQTGGGGRGRGRGRGGQQNNNNNNNNRGKGGKLNPLEEAQLERMVKEEGYGELPKYLKDKIAARDKLEKKKDAELGGAFKTWYTDNKAKVIVPVREKIAQVLGSKDDWVPQYIARSLLLDDDGNLEKDRDGKPLRLTALNQLVLGNDRTMKRNLGWFHSYGKWMDRILYLLVGLMFLMTLIYAAIFPSNKAYFKGTYGKDYMGEFIGDLIYALITIGLIGFVAWVTLPNIRKYLGLLKAEHAVNAYKTTYVPALKTSY